MKPTTIVLMCCLALQFCPITDAAPPGTAFNYSGVLRGADDVPAEGVHDLRFVLYDAPAGGIQIGPIVTNANVLVTGGLLRAKVDFGAGVFNGTAYWLEIAVRPSSSGDFTVLDPRQPILTTPYSVYAAEAGSAAGVATNSIRTASLQNNSVTPEKLASGGLVTSLNGLRDDIALLAGPGILITPSGNAIKLAADGQSGDAWKLTGNGGTSPGIHFLGTTDNQPLTFKVNNTLALLLRFNGNSPNIIAGGANNSIGTLTRGSIILGGGDPVDPNTIEDDVTFGTIAGGQGNLLHSRAANSCIVGGSYNTISAALSVISGGSRNSVDVNAVVSTIGGGYNNVVAQGASSSTIAGGTLNTISTNASYSFIGGGLANTALNNARWSMIGGGQNNASSNSSLTVIGGGEANRIVSSHRATIGGGMNNFIDVLSSESVIGGGRENSISSALNSTIGGGLQNTNRGAWATIPGGELNVAAGDYAFAAGRRAKANHTGSYVWSDSSGGDFVSTDVDQYIVRAARGVGINTNRPATAFHVHGTVTASAFAVAGPVTRYLSIPIHAFRPQDDSVRFGIYVGADLARLALSVGSGTFAAPLHLPQGATITELRVWLQDNHGTEDITATLESWGLTGSGQIVHANLISSGAEVGSRLFTDSSIVSPVVDNANRYYILSASWSIGADNPETLTLRGARITYTIDQPLP